jgi:1-acyl-sn-glycerol-3-phosphate acyltransferase
MSSSSEVAQPTFLYPPLPFVWFALYRLYYCLVQVPLSGIVLTSLASLVVIVLTSFAPRFSHVVGVWWGRALSFLALLPIRPQGLEHIRAGQSYVVIANHQSHMDVVVLYAKLPLHFRWVMKQELRNVPLFGMACERMGHVFVERRNRDKAIRSLERAKERLTDGSSIIFFPEGKRTNQPVLQPFKKGAFRMALDLGLPVLPVTVRGTGDVMPSGALLFRRPAPVDLIVHPEISVTGKTVDDMEALIEEARRVIQSGWDTGKPSS